MSFIGNVVSSEPFYTGASQHPHKPLFHFGSRETTMSKSYDGTLLDHLAEHMIHLSTASSFWFSLNLSYDHGCNLSQQLGITRANNNQP